MLFEDDDWVTTRIDQSKPPLRWYANMMGSIGSWAILKCAFADEDGREKAASIYGYIYSKTLPIWSKYGTHYKVNMPIEEDI